MQEKKKREFPDVYALLFIMCVLAMVATWIIPAGTFERVKEGSINKVVAGSFQYVAANPQTPWDMLQAIYQAFVNSSSTIFMIFFCGAAIAMLEESKSLSTAFTVLARKLRGKEAVAMAVIMFSLGLGNSAGVFGNLGIAIVPIGVFLAKAMGGRCLSWLPYHLLWPDERYVYRFRKSWYSGAGTDDCRTAYFFRELCPA
ncbi:hypothetical protein [Enterocloster sp.]|uniref:hypothetical protein n=1 Tax=Enterocloster sp. TaxID=2719315 RepID=UPI0039955E18